MKTVRKIVGGLLIFLVWYSFVAVSATECIDGKCNFIETFLSLDIFIMSLACLGVLGIAVALILVGCVLIFE